MIEELASFLVDKIFDFGYIGIFLLMAIESSFIPFPSEIVLIPAGYLAYKGDMSITLIMISATLGSLVGAFINYYLAYFVGRTFLEKYGKYFFISQDMLCKMDRFFILHGSISTFSGRLIPGVRQLISIPAGLSKMDIKKFSLYTAVGAGIWSLILVLLGYFIGENQELIQTYLKEITTVIIICVALGLLWYTLRNRNKER